MDEPTTTESEGDTVPTSPSTQPDTDNPTSPPPPICPYCPLPLREDDLYLPVTTLKQKRAVETCNKWSKRRNIGVIVEVGKPQVKANMKY